LFVPKVCILFLVQLLKYNIGEFSNE